MTVYQSSLLGAAALMYWFVLPLGFGTAWAIAVLAVAAAIAERGRVRLGTYTEASISLLPTVFAAAIFGPAAAMLVAVTSLAGDFPPFLTGARRREALERGSPYMKWGIYSCTRALTAGGAGLAAHFAAAYASGAYFSIAMSTIAAALVAEPLDVVFVGVTMRVRGMKSLEPLKALATVMLASIPLYTPIVAILAIAYANLSPWTLPLFLVPALAAQRMFGLYQQQRELAEGLFHANEQLEDANLSFATALVATLDARDRYTAGHSAAVAVYSLRYREAP